MKTVFFTEEQLKDLQQTGQALFDDPEDPRSMSYCRKLVRPSIHWVRALLFVIVPIAALFLMMIALRRFGVPANLTWLIAALLLVVYIALMLKRAAIFCIRVYQRVAPDSVRNQCRFEPSCSQYMILAIQKYGLWKGIRKGRDRLKRCNIHGGGYDFP